MMTIETDCDNPRVVSLTNFNQFSFWLLFGASGGAKASLKKATHAGETRGHLFRWPFFMVSFFHALFCITLVQILRLQSDSLGQYG